MIIASNANFIQDLKSNLDTQVIMFNSNLIRLKNQFFFEGQHAHE